MSAYVAMFNLISMQIIPWDNALLLSENNDYKKSYLFPPRPQSEGLPCCRLSDRSNYLHCVIQ